ncbi:dihydrofolate reductase family protein [Streptomyces sp. NPDC057307]|uniref:dihydrofolate reductase family protein n=1 Tax=Streptomyces sp. NPDC057307 TaxID=3346096 RepID=UPI00363A5A79
MSKYVVSRTPGDPGWQHTTVLRGEVRDEVRELKAGPGGDIVTTGSVTLTRELVAAGLVDEYRLFAYPGSSGTAGGCSPTRPRCRDCGWSRACRSPPASCCRATARRNSRTRHTGGMRLTPKSNKHSHGLRAGWPGSREPEFSTGREDVEAHCQWQGIASSM